MVPWYDFPSTQCIRIHICSSMTLHVTPGDGFFLAHRGQWYGFLIVWIFMWRLVWSVVVCYLLFTFQMLIWLLWIICPFGTFSMLHFMLPSSQFFLSFRYFFNKHDCNNQKGIVWSLGYCFIHICCVNPFSENFVLLHWSQLNCRFSTDKVKIEISETMIFSILSRFSFLYWLSCFFIGIHCFFKSVTNLQSYSGCSSPLPPPQSSIARSPPWALVTSVDWFMGAVPRYWGCLTFIGLKHFPHMSHLNVTLGPG